MRCVPASLPPKPMLPRLFAAADTEAVSRQTMLMRSQFPTSELHRLDGNRTSLQVGGQRMRPYRDQLALTAVQVLGKHRLRHAGVVLLLMPTRKRLGHALQPIRMPRPTPAPAISSEWPHAADVNIRRQACGIKAVEARGRRHGRYRGGKAARFPPNAPALAITATADRYPSTDRESVIRAGSETRASPLARARCRE